MSIIVDDSPDDRTPSRPTRISRLEALKDWLLHRDSERDATATRDIVSRLYPSRRPASEDAPTDQTPL